MRLITAKEQQAVDRTWQDRTGLPLLLLMEAAAAAVVRQCRKFAEEQNRAVLPVLILAGRGQNGGDGLACARLLLAAGWPVICREVFAGIRLPAEAEANRLALIGLGCRLGPPENDDFAKVHDGLIVDGIFGSGYRSGRDLPEAFASLSRRVAEARRRGARVLAIDVPSGLDTDSGIADVSCIQADCTVTFISAKPGLCTAPGRFLAGQVVVDPIGIGRDLVGQVADQSPEPPAWQLDGGMIRDWRPERPPDSHKGLFGKLLQIGGAAGMPGAVVLAAEAAARSGLGLLHLAVPSDIAAAVLSVLPEALLLPLAGDEQVLDNIGGLAGRVQAVAIGPGIGRPAWLADLLPALIRNAPQLVIDADALNWLALDPAAAWQNLHERTGLHHLPPAVLTPHPGEFHRLAPDIELADRLSAARKLAARSGSLIVLKGAATIVAEPDGRAWINPTGQDGLARGGSGDVLCGLIGGLLAQGLAPRAAAAAGVYLHGLAADLAADRLGRRAMLPRDVIANLGLAFSRAGWEKELCMTDGA